VCLFTVELGLLSLTHDSIIPCFFYESSLLNDADRIGGGIAPATYPIQVRLH
jgi:hypothetical protein